MSVKNISSAILGVGVDDTTIDLFESQYPVPTGVRLVSVPDFTMGMSSRAGKLPFERVSVMTSVCASCAFIEATFAKRAP